jgi:hypothetical protein
VLEVVRSEAIETEVKLEDESRTTSEAEVVEDSIEEVVLVDIVLENDASVLVELEDIRRISDVGIKFEVMTVNNEIVELE